jgi:putative transcriptional regulator
MENNLRGRLLIATPSMNDTRFERSVILVCDHDEEHALGLVINKIVPDMSLQNLLLDLGFENIGALAPLPVLEGGPCQPERGFVLHSSEWVGEGTININENIAMTVSKEILAAINDGECPAKHIVALGYAGWGPGQLENEIRENSWLVSDISSDIVFSTVDYDKKWHSLFRQNGIDLSRLSPFSGHA